MIVYTLTYLINSLGFFLRKRDRKFIFALTVLLLIFISGTRYYMGGSDVYVYEGFYEKVPSLQYIFNNLFFGGYGSQINDNYEIGFSILCSTIKTLGFNYFGFILIYSILFYYLMFKGLKEFVPNWAPFIAMFMYKIMFYNTFISIRQGLTIAIFCYSLPYLRDKKWIQYFFLSFIAFLEHRGAMIMFPLCLIHYLPISKRFIKYYALFFAPTWFIRDYVDLTDVLIKLTTFIGNDRALEHWLDSAETISLVHTFECYLMVLLVLMFYKNIMSYKDGKEAKLVLRLFLITIPMFTLFSSWILITREKDYFVLMYGIIFAYIICSSSKRRYYTSEGTRTINIPFLSTATGKMVGLAIVLVCFIGMARYVFAFDGGTLMDFESFVFKGISIFN